ncbi:hypothetical protein LN650_15780 [Klebsiella pneumoniae subsp. pneumoniae]|nr:hypothetical protein [Klebsiella pneumoniae subsp. pneumoniae]
MPLLVKVDSADPTLLRGADYLSILLLALSLGCLEYTLEEGPRWGWFDDATLTTTAWVAPALRRGLCYPHPCAIRSR